MSKFFRKSLYTIVMLLVLVQSSFALNQVELSVEYIANPAIGRALSLADIYVGIVDLDPKIVGNQKQISVLQENGTTVQVAQPISTSAGGVPLYNGSPVTILVNGSYSLRIDDSVGSQIYYVPQNALLSSTESIGTVAELRAITETPADGKVFPVLGYDSADENRDWTFKWDASDLSTEVTADISSGIYIAPSSDLTGASGAWVRLTSGLIIDIDWFDIAKDNIVDDGPTIKYAADLASSIKGKLKLSEGSYYIADPGITLLSDTNIEGVDGKTFLRCERTYFDSTGTGSTKYIVAQGNIFNGDSLTNVTLKNITLVGAYDTAWGNQTNGGPVPAGGGSKLLFLLDSENITLEGFDIKDSFSSFISLTSDWEQYYQEVYGYHKILISGCTNVKLKDCAGYDSLGESWHIFNSDIVRVENCDFINDYGVSYLDITYCTDVKVTGSTFEKVLSADTGNLLNIASAEVLVTGCYFKNGELDIGNEYLAIASTLTAGDGFLLHDTVVENNVFYNSGVTFATQDGTTPLTWTQENAVVSNNTITINIDDRPSASGTTALEYTAVRLPASKNNRNILIEGNTILLKGTLQSGGATYNKIRIFNALMLASGFNMENIKIANNDILVDLDSYDSDDINDDSGVLYIKYGNWSNLVFENNTVNCPSGITIDEHDSLSDIVIENNEFQAENFIVMPYTATDFVIDNFSVKNNKFNFYNTLGHTYTSTDLNAKGYGYFILMLVASSSVEAKTAVITGFDVKGNTVESPALILMSNFAANPLSVQCDVMVEQNKVDFVDYLDTAETFYPLLVGRINTNSDYSSLRLIDNYFVDNQVTAPVFTVYEYDKLDILRNTFTGDFDLDLDTDNLAAVTGSRVLLLDNILTGSTTTSISNVNTAITRLSLRNTTAFGFAGITSTITTDP